MDALKQMETGLKEKSQLLRIAFKKLDDKPKLSGIPQIHKDIMFVLAQNHFFDSSSGLTVKDLADIFTKSEATIRKIIKKLPDLSLIEQRGERPAFFCAKQRYFEY